MARFELPERDEHLVDVLDAELGTAESEMNLNRVGWRIIDGYLRGARKFNVLDRFSGKVSVGYEHLKGDVLFRYEDIVRRYLIEIGRWLRSDFGPVARRKGESLGDLRKASIANAILQARVAKIDLRRLRTELVIPYIKYGVVGIAHYETGDADNPDQVEVVPPHQLRGIPPYSEGSESMQGIARVRWVPYDWLKERVKLVYDIDLDKYDAESELEAIRVAWGHSPPGSTILNDGRSGAYPMVTEAPDQPPLYTERERGIPSEDSDDIREDGRYYVKLEEVYPYADDSLYAAAYILKVGRVIVYRENFEETGQRVICPLQVARYTDTGSFFARGFVAPLIPANDQFEKVVSSVARNIRDMDMMGSLMVSGGMNIDLKSWNKPGPRPKSEKYNVDPLAPNAQPFVLQPANIGTMPVQFGQFLTTISDKLSGQGPFFDGQAAGRIDSAAGLGFLFNTGNVGLGLPSHNIANALSAIYGRILQIAKGDLSEGQSIKLATIDENLAGVVFNPQSGELSLDQNPIPNPWEVELDIRDRTPRDPDVRKKELSELYGAGLLGTSPDEAFIQYWITVFEENLDVIGGPKDIYETWRKVIWQIILLFNDGETPGPVEFGEHTQDPRVQIMALQRFMNKIEFSLSSDEVQREFEVWKEALERLMGVDYPAGLPPPEEAAAMELQGQQPGQSPPGVVGGQAPPPPPGGMGGVDIQALMGGR